jgi:hypothetical protein
LRKIICIDYDGTYTAMPELINSIIVKCRELDYIIYLATMRYENEVDDNFIELMAKVDKTIFTGRQAKLYYLLSIGIKPDLWIDDNPTWLLTNSG